MNIATIGIDLAKNVFQLHGVNSQGKVNYHNDAAHEALLQSLRQRLVEVSISGGSGGTEIVAVLSQ